MNTVRLGQLAGNKNVFYGAKFNQKANKILSYTYQGAFYLWNKGETLRDWTAFTAMSGHFRPVN